MEGAEIRRDRIGRVADSDIDPSDDRTTQHHPLHSGIHRTICVDANLLEHHLRAKFRGPLMNAVAARHRDVSLGDS